MTRYIARLGLTVIVALARWSVVQADSDIWKVGVGNWETGTSWLDGTTPGNSDSATFSNPGTTTATFGVAPAAIQDLTVSAGTVAFQSSGGAKNLLVTSASGTQTVSITGATTSLTLGTTPSNAVNLTAGGNVTIAAAGALQTNSGSTFTLSANKIMTITGGGRATFAGDYTTATNAIYNISGALSKLETSSPGLLFINNGAQVNVSAGGLISTPNNLFVGTVSTGTLVIDGSGSSAAAGPSAESTWGASGGTANITFSNGAMGTFLGGIALANYFTSPAGATANLTVQSGAVLTVGNINMANPTTANTSATLSVQGNGSAVTQPNGDSAIIGGTSGSTAAINIGTVVSGAAFTKGPVNALEIRKTGTVTIGSASTFGTLISNGGVNISGGVLQVNNAASTFTLPAGRTMNITGGGRATFNTNYTTASATYNISGNLSTLETKNGGALNINNGGQVNLDSGGQLLWEGNLNVGTVGNGILSINGVSSRAGQSNSGTTTVGQSTMGTTAAINIGNAAAGGLFDIDAGSLRINKTGTVTIGNGSEFRVNGDVTIDGGALQTIGSSSVFRPDGHTVTIQSGGHATFSSNSQSFYNVTNVVYNVSGVNANSVHSELEAPFLAIHDGGQVNITSGGLVSSTELDVQSNGALSVDGGGSSAVANLGLWGFTGTTASVSFRNNATGTFNGAIGLASANVTVQTSADLTVGDLILAVDGGATTSATLTITDAGSTVTLTSGRSLTVGHSSSGTAVINVLNSGALTVGVGGSTILNATGTININGGSADLKTLTINGGTLNFTAGSLSYIGNLTVGTGGLLGTDLTLPGNRQLTLSGTTTIDAAHTLTLSGGTLNTDSMTVNGTLTFNSGTLGITGAGGLTIGSGQFLGSSVTLGTGSNLNVTNTLTVASGAAITVNGGTLNTGSLAVSGIFSFNSGTLGVTGASGLTIGSGQPLGSSIALGTGSNLNVINTLTVSGGSILTLNGGNATAGNLTNTGTTIVNSGNLSVSGTITNPGSGRLFVGSQAAFDTPGAAANQLGGRIELLGGAARLGGAGALTNAGVILGSGEIAKPVTNTAGGEIRADSGNLLLFSAASGTNAGQINLQGGTAEFSQALTNGPSGQIVGRGTLKVGSAGLTNNGNIALASGITDVFGDVNNNTGTSVKGIAISGNAAVNFWDDVTNTSGLFKVNSGSTATFFGTFSGNGITGNANDIHFESDISPGFSPASITIGGNVSFGAAAMLKIELGGTTPGAQFDQVHVTGQLSLDGTLQVLLINGFLPALGNTFDIVDWGNLSGTFATVQLPALQSGRSWDTSQLYTSGVLAVVAAGLPGDYNLNGVVDAADYVVWRKGLGTIYTPNDYNVWRAHFGQIAGSGSGASLNSAVPEPAALVLLMIAAAGCCLLRGRSA